MRDTFSSIKEPAHPYQRPEASGSRDSISNNAIVIAAILCFGALMLVVVLTLIVSKAFSEPERTELSAEQDAAAANAPIVTEFNEGYSMILPSEFAQKTRRETAAGDIVYGFSAKDGCKLTFAIINDKTLNRFSSPPKSYPEALIKHIPELSQGIEGKVAPAHFSVGGMQSVFFQFYEKETYRGVVFTYYMVTMDRGIKLVLKIAGKYGNYSDMETNVNMPGHWQDAMLTLRRTGPAR
jgi:hypothetical protein